MLQVSLVTMGGRGGLFQVLSRDGTWLQTHLMYEYAELDSQRGLMFGQDAVKFSLLNTSILQNVTFVSCPKNVQ
jgi:hypothetical protein